MYFELLYCNEKENVVGIITSVITSIDSPYSLVEQWGCPTTVGDYYDCTSTTAITVGWPNTPSSPVSLLSMQSDSKRNVSNGVYVAVWGM